MHITGTGSTICINIVSVCLTASTSFNVLVTTDETPNFSKSADESSRDLSYTAFLMSQPTYAESLAQRRLPKSAAAIGNLVSLKPVISLPEDGTVALIGKQIGMHRAYKQIAALVEEDGVDEQYPIYFIYCADKRNCAGFVQYLKKSGMAPEEPKLRGIGPTIASHIGPGAFGVVFVKKSE